MAFEPVTMYRVLCDRCGVCAQDGSDYYAWMDQDQAWIEADCSEWKEIDGKHYCDGCWTWDEETDEPKPVAGSDEQAAK